ncbi:hypothetical protein [Streptomyces sp. YPW6]
MLSPVGFIVLVAFGLVAVYGQRLSRVFRRASRPRCSRSDC